MTLCDFFFLLRMKAASFPVGAVVFANVSTAIAALIPATVVVVAMPAWMAMLLGWVHCI